MASAGGPSITSVVNASGDVWMCIDCGSRIEPRTTHACAPAASIDNTDQTTSTQPEGA